MKLIRTAKFILPIGAATQLLPCVEAYTKAYNYCCQIGWDQKVSRGTKLHELTYLICREQFGMPAQLACSVRGKAIESLKSVRGLRSKRKRKITCPQSKRASIRYDIRSYTLNLESRE